ncbi:hypothetical protein TCDM_02340 [Trypanosoma cruzi Dm28c]|uniref:Uncharacterized protein n=1 Tax=Trypanosoma cruzi Dm28c TaxID=1416333 RepID=V5BRN6_TRYCR|nr:hypothetical protein TCDM_02340 [Trypanosoma cruzi Dm28c]
MPPLTLEQVLARSMRLPRKHMKHTATPMASNPATGISTPPDNSLGRGDKSVAKLFSLIEKDEESTAAGRPFIHQSNNLIRNSHDLLTYLHTAKRMRAWEDALRSFAEVTKMLLINQTEEGDGVSLTLREGAEGAGGVTASVSHLALLLDTCAAAKQWHLVEQIGEIFRSQSRQTLIDAVAVLANTKKETIGEGLYGWERALHFLQTRIPPEEQPVEAYNACIAACETALEWEGALAIVRSMGPNPLQKLDSKAFFRHNRNWCSVRWFDGGRGFFLFRDRGEGGERSRYFPPTSTRCGHVCNLNIGLGAEWERCVGERSSSTTTSSGEGGNHCVICRFDSCMV